MSVLLDVDPWTGAREYMDYDTASGVLTIRRSTDVTAILDANVDKQNRGVDKGEEGDFWHAARVPLVVLEGWMREFTKQTGAVMFSPFDRNPEWERFVDGRLNSNEWRKLRTGLFRI